MKFIKVIFVLGQGSNPNDAHLATGEHFISTNDIMLLTKLGENSYSVKLKPEAKSLLPNVVLELRYHKAVGSVLEL